MGFRLGFFAGGSSIIFKLLVLGSAIHVFWDVLQKQFFLSDYYLFYPISLYAPKIDLFYYISINDKEKRSTNIGLKSGIHYDLTK